MNFHDSRLSAEFEEVADTVFVADLLPADSCRAVLSEFCDSPQWDQAKIAISRRNDSGATEIIGIVDTTRRNASRIRFADRDMSDKPVTVDCLRYVQTAVSAFASGEFGLDFSECADAEIVRYPTGGEFKPHTDAHTGNAHRAFTAIIYLNDDFTGGETSFPDLNYTCTPKCGRVLLFMSTQLHASLPIVDGWKNIIVFWVHYPGGSK